MGNTHLAYTAFVLQLTVTAGGESWWLDFMSPLPLLVVLDARCLTALIFNLMLMNLTKMSRSASIPVEINQTSGDSR